MKSAMNETMTTKSVNISVEELIDNPKNARTHSVKQVNKLAKIIERIGFINPIIIDEKNIILAGHGRLMAAKKIGLELIPCVQVEHLSEAEKTAYMLADNRIALESDFDENILKINLNELKQDDFDLAVTGFDENEIDDFFRVEPEASDEDDKVPTIEKIERSKTCDVWILGRHRLMCGDSTDAETVNKLIQDKAPDMVYTDPPYGINEKGDRSKRGGLAQGGNFKDFIDDSIEHAVKAFDVVQNLKIKKQVWWGANYYAHHIPQTNNWFVWDKRVEDNQRDTQSDCELAWVLSKWSSVRIFRHLWKGMLKDSERGNARVHPTQKPVALALWAFDYFGNIKSVLDLFGGSGSTLIACEKQEIPCFMMELDPHYVDVIITRWQNLTNEDAYRESDNVTFNSLSKGK